MLNTFLSPEIRQLLVIEIGSNESDLMRFMTECTTVDWEKVNFYFEPEIVLHNQPLPYEYCAALTPKFHQFLQSFKSIDQPNNLQWTNRLDLLESVLSNPTRILENSLILTSIVEYTLGNLYQTETGCAPPHLLRDLLMTDALTNLLGETVIFVLRLLLGTPNGVNLRNLVWHGFPRAEEVSAFYQNFLIAMLISIGSRLEELKYDVEFRTCSLNSNELVRKMGLPSFDVSLLEKAVIESANEIVMIQKCSWLRSAALYRTGQFYRCVCVVLPQLEMFLRAIYAELYSKDFLAKIDEYYIIMDTIFEEFDATTKTKNLIHDYFPQALLETVFDLFSAIRGPRLRDKLSHGELQIAEIDEQVANAVLFLSFVILVNDSEFEYKSCFHHNAILDKSIRYCEYEIEKCNNLGLPSENQSEVSENGPFLPEISINERIPIFYRPTKEEEIIGYLQRITAKLQLSSANLHESLSVRLDALANRELRSRTRKSLETMLQMFPVILRGLRHVLNIVKWTFYCLINSEELRETDKLIRFLKFILKYVENAANNLNIKSNAWQPLFETTRRELYDKTRQNLTLLLC